MVVARHSKLTLIRCTSHNQNNPLRTESANIYALTLWCSLARTNVSHKGTVPQTLNTQTSDWIQDWYTERSSAGNQTLTAKLTSPSWNTCFIKGNQDYFFYFLIRPPYKHTVCWITINIYQHSTIYIYFICCTQSQTHTDTQRHVPTHARTHTQTHARTWTHTDALTRHKQTQRSYHKPLHT